MTKTYTLHKYHAPGMDSYALSQLYRHKDPSHPLIIIVSDTSHAKRLQQEIAFFSGTTVDFLPDWETLAYESLSPNEHLISERIRTLWRIYQHEAQITVIPLIAAMQFFPEPTFLSQSYFDFSIKQHVHRDRICEQLTNASYALVKHVMSPGEYAIRGSIIDIFPMGADQPFRLDLDDDLIDSIHLFDVDTQKSSEARSHIHILPAREFPFHEEAKKRFRTRYRALFEGKLSEATLYKQVSQNICPPGIEYYLPLFFEKLSPLQAYFPQESLLVLHGAIDEAFDQLMGEINARYRLLSTDVTRPPLPPTYLYQEKTEFFHACKTFHNHRLRLYTPEEIASGKTDSHRLPSISIDRTAEHPLAKLLDFLAHYSHYKIYLIAETEGRISILSELLEEYHCPFEILDVTDTNVKNGTLYLQQGTLFQGFIAHTEACIYIAESDFFNFTTHRPKKTQKNLTLDLWIRSLSELKEGCPIVHQQHGIGRYRGMTTTKIDDIESELVVIEYAHHNLLYIPITQLHLISRYKGLDDEHIILSSLEKKQFDKQKEKAQKHIQDTAVELLALYAQREQEKNTPCVLDETAYRLFSSRFGFELTEDQASSISAVLEDLCSDKPMNRLICGDVGFGKTEVALRAAFVAAHSGQQVAFLCPTTLLASQHYETFINRFAYSSTRIVLLSRFNDKKHINQIISDLKKGHIDIVIGTHRLLQQDIAFKQLGLVIIDEEHRFGVKQKEQLCMMTKNVNILCLTATPIPRTLSIALEGIRTFSLITTPPKTRLSIKTIVTHFNTDIIKDAISREIKRGGQVYFLHNKIQNIQEMHDHLITLVPEIRIAIGHGQKNERELEHVMRDFYAQKYNVLLCTTIIENGIDNHNANTIIINDAHKFGLAQLHQIRGRVGRSHHQGYAYLIIPDEVDLTEDAKKRLDVLQNMGDLGAGFYLAMHDLEIRGAGELLGESQSGTIKEIGFELYQKMLSETLHALRHSNETPISPFKDINFHETSLIPEYYCSDPNTRLILYKRISEAHDYDQLHLIQEEIIDRFGKMSIETQRLFDLHKLRIEAERLDIIGIEASSHHIILEFGPKPSNPTAIFRAIQSSDEAKLLTGDRIKLSHLKKMNFEDKLKTTRLFLDKLSK